MIRTHILLFFIAAPAFCQSRTVAITIDDLPVAQSGKRACEFERLQSLTAGLLKPLRNEHVPVTAFVIGGNCPDLTTGQRRTVIGEWLAAGAEIGNHTFSHRSLTTTPIAEYEADILRAEPVIKAATGGRPLRYFRSPMLHTGADIATKRRLESFLSDHGYRQSPVTFDNSDWMFAYVYANALDNGEAALATRVRGAYLPYMESVIEFFEKRSVDVVGREFPQILLIHANRLNAAMLPDLLVMLRKRGYKFISLETALRDPAYSLPNEYAGKGGFSWIHRWSQTKGMPNKGEPGEPDWLAREYRLMSK
jgi:peptidoglycan/xylan/chitin deacetylase (PgdA/CDA1 family)